MSSKIPFRINELNINNICYTDIKSTKTKTIIYLKYNDNRGSTDGSNKTMQNIVFQTPNLLNVSEIVNKTSKKSNIYELDIPIKGKSDNKINNFLTFLNDIDNKIIKDARNNPQWFSSFPNKTTMKYQRIIRESDDESYSDGIIRLKILKTNDFNTIINLNNKKFDLKNNTDVLKNCWVKTILEIYAIWVNENGFGLFIRPILMDFKINPSTLYNYKLMEDSDECDDMEDDLCTIQDNYDNSVFIRSENDLTSSILEIPSSILELDDISESDSSKTGISPSGKKSISDQDCNTKDIPYVSDMSDSIELSQKNTLLGDTTSIDE